jgi:hypothetical protein
VPSSPLSRRLFELHPVNRQRRIAHVRLWADHVPRGFAEVAQLLVGHLDKALPQVFEIQTDYLDAGVHGRILPVTNRPHPGRFAVTISELRISTYMRKPKQTRGFLMEGQLHHP